MGPVGSCRCIVVHVVGLPPRAWVCVQPRLPLCAALLDHKTKGEDLQGAQQQVGGEGVDDDGDAPGPSNRAAVFGASVEDIW